MSATIGILLLVGTLVEGYLQSFAFHQEHYIWPKEKYGLVTPPRWQDKVFLVAFWIVAFGLSYSWYRLLKYSFRRES